MQNFLVFLWLILLAGCSGPKAYFETGELKNITPETVYFSNLSSKADHFFWDFGTGIKSTEKNPSFRYLTSGRYIVKLTAFKKKKKSTFSKEILFVAPSDCLIEVKTSKGSFLIKLHEETPLHNENFLKLIQQEFYTGTIFHRVINGFMIQGGDPETKHPQKDIRYGNGGPGYTIPSEIHDKHFHIKGALAAARISDEFNLKKESSGSQFYIVHGRPVDKLQLKIFESQKNIYYNINVSDIYETNGGAPQLDMEYTVFGQVIEGLDIIDAIASSPTDSYDRPKENISIISITVIK
ncbi:MAG: peptidylprolyl isomerase [Saprospiraceae bacterium]|nr:peptidylprolyl isomerase [Saprospiraceae bacterium]MBK6564701.1 peptidylprolyl isomerase [Saprospiraceae bacterium]MBK6784775.1 peptidylprolyl isomerase [Saprospiraceae bacterium]MBK8371666.1 peptidylprolyl isomerase [Saprospiraceae bacterium]MBK8548926.1 peptidylprolyl isomerase [Saprospiraceae bacterium]